MRFLLSLIGFLTSTAHAQTLEHTTGDAPGTEAMWEKICNVIPCSAGGGGSTGTIDVLVGKVIAFIFPLIAVVAVLLFMYAGILIVTSNGSEDKVSQAKKIMMYAAAGVVLSLLTTAVIGFIVSYLGILLS